MATRARVQRRVNRRIAQVLVVCLESVFCGVLANDDAPVETRARWPMPEWPVEFVAARVRLGVVDHGGELSTVLRSVTRVGRSPWPRAFGKRSPRLSLRTSAPPREYVRGECAAAHEHLHGCTWNSFQRFRLLLCR